MKPIVPLPAHGCAMRLGLHSRKAYRISAAATLSYTCKATRRPVSRCPVLHAKSSATEQTLAPAGDEEPLFSEGSDEECDVPQCHMIRSAAHTGSVSSAISTVPNHSITAQTSSSTAMVTTPEAGAHNAIIEVQREDISEDEVNHQHYPGLNTPLPLASCKVGSGSKQNTHSLPYPLSSFQTVAFNSCRKCKSLCKLLRCLIIASDFSRNKDSMVKT